MFSLFCILYSLFCILFIIYSAFSVFSLFSILYLYSFFLFPYSLFLIPFSFFLFPFSFFLFPYSLFFIPHSSFHSCNFALFSDAVQCSIAWNCRNPTISRSLFKLLHIFSRGLVFNDMNAFQYEKWLNPITSHGSRITLISGIRIWHYRLTPQHRLRILNIFRFWNLWNLWLMHFCKMFIISIVLP